MGAFRRRLGIFHAPLTQQGSLAHAGIQKYFADFKKIVRAWLVDGGGLDDSGCTHTF
jgi:hypothetical protein